MSDETIRLGEIEMVKIQGFEYKMQSKFESYCVNVSSPGTSQLLMVYVGPTDMFKDESKKFHNKIINTTNFGLPSHSCMRKTKKHKNRIFGMKLPNCSGYIFAGYTLPINSDTSIADKLIESIHYIHSNAALQ